MTLDWQYKQFPSQYDSRAVIYERKLFLRLATGKINALGCATTTTATTTTTSTTATTTTTTTATTTKTTATTTTTPQQQQRPQQRQPQRRQRQQQQPLQVKFTSFSLSKLIKSWHERSSKYNKWRPHSSNRIKPMRFNKSSRNFFPHCQSQLINELHFIRPPGILLLQRAF